MGSIAKFLNVQIAAKDGGQRLDAWLAAQYPDISRSRWHRHILAHKVLVNGNAVKPRYVLAVGDSICGEIEAEARPLLLPSKIPLHILFEDDAIIVVNKPAGLSVHPGAGANGPSLVAGLLYHTGSKLSPDCSGKGERPGIVHRLDKDTSGVLVCTKTAEAYAHVAAQFQGKTNKREYVALLDGLLVEEELAYESYLYRDPQHRLSFASLPTSQYPQVASGPLRYRYAKSHFYRQAVFGHRLSLVGVRLATGRTHQIRVHSRALGLPILGDPLYHRPTLLPQTFSEEVRGTVWQLKRQMLHAACLGIKHPRNGEYMEFQAPLPEDFERLLGMLAPYSCPI